MNESFLTCIPNLTDYLVQCTILYERLSSIFLKTKKENASK